SAGRTGSTAASDSSPCRPIAWIDGEAVTTTVDPAGAATPVSNSEISRIISLRPGSTTLVDATVSPAAPRSPMVTADGSGRGFCSASPKNVAGSSAGTAKIAPESGRTGNTGSVTVRRGRVLLPTEAARRYE